MTTISNLAAPAAVYVSSRWEIVDNFGYVLDEVTVEAAADTPERDVEALALNEFAADQRAAYEPGHYKAEVVINSIAYARRL